MPADPIRADAPPTTGRGELVTSDRQALDQAAGAAAEAVRRMSEEGRSGKVTVSMAVEVEQYPEAEIQHPAALAERQAADHRFALGMAAGLGVLVTVLASSLLPGLFGLLCGVVAAAWIFGHLKP